MNLFELIYMNQLEMIGFFVFRNNYVLKQEHKEKLSSFLDSVSKTNEKYKKIQTLSVLLIMQIRKLKKITRKLRH